QTRHKIRLLVEGKETPHKQRMHALWVLMSTWRLEDGLTHYLMTSGDGAMTHWLVRLLGNVGRAREEELATFDKLAEDGSPDVKLQIAIASRKIDGVDPLPLLVKVAAHCGDDKLIPHIVWQNLHPLLETRSDDFLKEVKKYDLQKSPGLKVLMPRVTERILAAKKTK
ncbi:MAG TPA: HEAT repeat domain-containing protein, partial [Pirellulaceae bacterium]|nr:HEAT repeat domain-containing protein [Pirellulaceae bacterium]